VGDVQQVNLSFAARGFASEWHLDRVEVMCSVGGDGVGIFPWRKWIKRSCTLEMFPDKDGDGEGDVGKGVATVEYKVRCLHLLISYNMIHIVTAMQACLRALKEGRHT
jgi:hypothetical protein